MNLELTELQQITLRDILITTGLTARQVEDIFLLLSFKRERVQLAFYYRAQGMTFEKVGERIDVSHVAVIKIMNRECFDIFNYLWRFVVTKS